MSEDKCRPVEVDGEIIRVHGGAEMDATDREMFADVVRAAKRKFDAEAKRVECQHLHLTDHLMLDVWAENPLWVCDDCGKVCDA